MRLRGLRSNLDSRNISIHAPTKGATPLFCAINYWYGVFQSTHPRRVRHWVPGKFMLTISISIHAPTKGATYHHYCQVECEHYFNPRTHEGCDGYAALDTRFPGTFQSTHPRRVRLVNILLGLSRWKNFNPRTHEGCDGAVGFEDIVQCVFQSTHPRRVRLGLPLTFIPSTSFQSTHPRRVRPF